jgi:hypothetical protein
MIQEQLHTNIKQMYLQAIPIMLADVHHFIDPLIPKVTKPLTRLSEAWFVPLEYTGY